MSHRHPGPRRIDPRRFAARDGPRSDCGPSFPACASSSSHSTIRRQKRSVPPQTRSGSSPNTSGDGNNPTRLQNYFPPPAVARRSCAPERPGNVAPLSWCVAFAFRFLFRHLELAPVVIAYRSHRNYARLCRVKVEGQLAARSKLNFGQLLPHQERRQ